MKVTGIVTKAVERTREITIADKKLIMRRRAGAVETCADVRSEFVFRSR